MHRPSKGDKRKQQKHGGKRRGLPPAGDLVGSVRLAFIPLKGKSGKRKKDQLRDSLSAVVFDRDSECLWAVSDETASLERLERRRRGEGFTRHTSFPLRRFFELPIGDEAEGSIPARPAKRRARVTAVGGGEAQAGAEPKPKTREVDLEGLDIQGPWLWLVGSHALVRRRPAEGLGADKVARELEAYDAQPARHLLGRVPLAAFRTQEGRPGDLYDGRRAGCLPISWKRPKIGNGAARRRMVEIHTPLTDLLRSDPHLAPFLGIPAKENGFDIEGLAVAGDGRVFLGLRGPVLRGWAVVLELLPSGKDDAAALELTPLPGGNDLYRKHFLPLDGLGTRELARTDGDDLLLLAGPTMDLDGPVVLFRWKGALASRGVVVPETQLDPLFLVPSCYRGDHAEGITPFPAKGKGGLLVVYDSPAKPRRHDETAVDAALFALRRVR